MRDLIRDGDDGQSRAGAEAHRGQARRQAAFIGKPFQRAAARRAVHDARTDAAHDAGDVKLRQRVGDRVQIPREAREDAAGDDDEFRTKPVHEVRFQKHRPRFKKHKEREGDLNRGHLGVELFGQWVYEQRPAVLKVGDCDHPEDADAQHEPTGRIPDLRLRLAFGDGLVTNSVQ